MATARKVVKPKGGRKPKLTDELQTRLIGLLKAGVPRTVACPAVGIAERTLRIWRARAENGEVRYIDLFDDIDTACASAKTSLVIELRSATKKDWRAGAWLLERTDWKEFGVRAPVVEDGGQPSPVEVHVHIDDPKAPPNGAQSG